MGLSRPLSSKPCSSTHASVAARPGVAERGCSGSKAWGFCQGCSVCALLAHSRAWTVHRAAAPPTQQVVEYRGSAEERESIYHKQVRASGQHIALLAAAQRCHTACVLATTFDSWAA